MALFLDVVLAIASALFNGSYGAMAKLKSAREAQVPPHILSFWMCIGVCLSSTMLVINRAPAFTWLGILSGACIVGSSANAFVAIQELGVAIASGIWCAVSVLAWFAFRTTFVRVDTPSPVWVTVAMALLLGAIAGLAHSSQVFQTKPQSTGFSQLSTDENAALSSVPSANAASGDLDMEDVPLHGLSVEHVGAKSQGFTLRQLLRSPKVLGLACALMSGKMGGLVLAPMYWAPPQFHGVPFLPSAAVGVLVFTPFATLGMQLWSSGLPLLTSDLRSTLGAGLLPGLLAGSIWTLATLCSLLATPGLGPAAAYPLLQCGLFVAGLWGIWVHDELDMPAQKWYWPSGLLVVVAASILASL